MLKDGFDESRDIVSVKASEGKPHEPYKFTLTFKDLQPGAEMGNLDAYLMMSVKQGGKIKLSDGIPGITQCPWNVAVGAYDNKNFSVYDEKGSVENDVVKNLKFDSEKNTLEFSLDKDILRKKGWKDGSSLKLQPFTAKDFVKKLLTLLMILLQNHG